VILCARAKVVCRKLSSTVSVGLLLCSSSLADKELYNQVNSCWPSIPSRCVRLVFWVAPGMRPPRFLFVEQFKLGIEGTSCGASSDLDKLRYSYLLIILKKIKIE
jgi:hypothetical protein